MSSLDSVPEAQVLTPPYLPGLCSSCAVTYLLTTFPTTAPTFDEVAHLGAGVARALSGVQAYNLEHPPLVKWLAALPLIPFLQTPPAPTWPENQWALGRAVLTHWGLEGQAAISLARLPMVACYCLLLLSTYRLCREAWGQREALLALVLVAFCPILLGHGRLITTDVPLAALAVTSAWMAWRSVLRPSLPASTLLGVSLGALLATKYTGIVLVPGLVGATLWMQLRRKRPRTQLWKELVIPGISGACILQLCYGSQPFWIGWLEGFQQLGFNHAPEYAFYRRGAFSQAGFWDYFGYALSIKVGWGVLLLGVIGPIGWLASHLRRARVSETEPIAEDRAPGATRLWPFLLLPAGSYCLAVQLLAPQIGVRYLIPALPFLYIGLARAAVQFSSMEPRRWPMVWMVVGLQLASAAFAWPDPISFMNGVGGCYGTRGSTCLDDSNLDWGQDLARIGPELVRSGILESPLEPVRLLYFGTVEPREWLPGAERVDAAELSNPHPAVYVMSVQRLLRMAHAAGNPAWLNRFTPVAWVGNTYAVFDFRVKIGRNKVQSSSRAEGTILEGARS